MFTALLRDMTRFRKSIRSGPSLSKITGRGKTRRHHRQRPFDFSLFLSSSVPYTLHYRKQQSSGKVVDVPTVIANSQSKYIALLRIIGIFARRALSLLGAG